MKMWGGRFGKAESASANEFNASIAFDRALYKQDIRGSAAHAKMLGRQGIIGAEDAEKIIKALGEIEAGIESGEIELSAEQEDIHMNIEYLLTERVGEAGKKLHTARSRNDQIAVDMRMFLKDEAADIIGLLAGLRRALVELARRHQATVLPGYTHTQRAQPVTLAFHFMAYFQMFTRDAGRLEDCVRRADYLPLGSGALAGVAYDTDRRFLADELGFAHVGENAMDAVSDRDYAIEFLSAAAIIMTHLSRFCEELILWSSAEFGFIEIDDAFATGSSIMPQKKNADIAELIRGKTGRVFGGLVQLLTIMKGLPLAYNKDLQEGNPPVLDAAETLKASLSIFTDMLMCVKINEKQMRDATRKGFINATDAADYLVRKGVPFRSCHEIIGRIVLYCVNAGKTLDELSLDEFRSFSEHFGEDIYEAIDIENAIRAKKSYGSTSFESVERMIRNAEAAL